MPAAQQHAVEDLPEETLGFLRGSRYCETDLLSQVAWDLFEKTPPGWARVQAICDYVHHHITFGYEYARVTKRPLTPSTSAQESAATIPTSPWLSAAV